MNIILVSHDEIDHNRVTLGDHRAKHIVKILGCGKGDCVRIGIIGGQTGVGHISEIKRKFPFSVVMDVRFDSSPPPKCPVDIILALPRPIMLRRIFSQAAALGVQKIYIVNARRVEKSFWEASIVEPAEYRQHLLHGLEQATDTVLPEVSFHQRFKPFVEDFLPTVVSSYSHLLVAHPESKTSLQNLLKPGKGKALVAVGPEGGWIDYEMERFEQCGFGAFTLGPRILKVDTAVINIHGRIMAEVERRLQGGAE